MKTAIILHGMPSWEEYMNPNSDAQSNKHWSPWIQRQLIIKGVLAQAIELPKPYKPVYEDYKKVFEQFDINEETMLIGHSCSAGFLIRWLSENDVKVGKVALVAPWIDVNKEIKSGFFDFEIDPKISEKTKGLYLFYSSDDKDVKGSVDILKKTLKDGEFIELKEKGHFIISLMGTKEFPELRDVLLE